MTALKWSNVDRVCAAVDFTQQPAVLDLSKATFFEPFALVYLGMFLRRTNGLGPALQVIPPRDAAASAYLATQQFWDRFNVNVQRAGEAKLRVFSNSTSLNDIVDIEQRVQVAESVDEAVVDLLRRENVRVNSGEIGGLIAELVDNFAQHARSSHAALAMQWYPKIGRVLFAIGDSGIGIRASLSSREDYSALAGKPHWEAAAKALDPLVTRKAEGGTGLTDVADGVKALWGNMTLTTGNGYVRITRMGRTAGEMAYDLTGVQVEMSFPER